jgi:hypothetical protein
MMIEIRIAKQFLNSISIADDIFRHDQITTSYFKIGSPGIPVVGHEVV